MISALGNSSVAPKPEGAIFTDMSVRDGVASPAAFARTLAVLGDGANKNSSTDLAGATEPYAKSASQMSALTAENVACDEFCEALWDMGGGNQLDPINPIHAITIPDDPSLPDISAPDVMLVSDAATDSILIKAIRPDLVTEGGLDAITLMKPPDLTVTEPSLGCVDAVEHEPIDIVPAVTVPPVAMSTPVTLPVTLPVSLPAEPVLTQDNLTAAETSKMLESAGPMDSESPVIARVRETMVVQQPVPLAPPGVRPSIDEGAADAPAMLALYPAPANTPFTGLGTAPAPAVAPLPMPVAGPVAMQSPNWPVELITGPVSAMLDAATGNMVLDIAPEELGRLTISLSVQGDIATVRFQAETVEAARLLLDAERQLATELARFGMTLAGHEATSDRRQSGTPWAQRQRRDGENADLAEAVPNRVMTARLVNLIA